MAALRPYHRRASVARCGRAAGVAVTQYMDAVNHVSDRARRNGAELSETAHEVRADIERQVSTLVQQRRARSSVRRASPAARGPRGPALPRADHLDPADRSSSSRKPQNAPPRSCSRASSDARARVYAATGGAGADAEATRSVAGYILTKQKARVLASDLAHNVRACRGQPLDNVQRVVSPPVAGGWLTPEKAFKG